MCVRLHVAVQSSRAERVLRRTFHCKMFDDSPDRKPAAITGRLHLIANATNARRALDERRRQRQGHVVHITQASALDLWGGQVGKAEAVRSLLYESLASSWTSIAKKHGVPRKFLQETVLIAADAALSTHQRKFEALVDMLMTVDDVKLIAFTWRREYDETPTCAWVHYISSTGAMDGEVVPAKVMAASCAFTLVFKVLGDGCAASPAGGKDKLCTICGECPVQLLNMTNQRAEVILKTIRQAMLPPLTQATAEKVRNQFPTVASVVCTDLHPSLRAAEREEMRSGTWRSPEVFLRCGMHRARTAETKTQELDSTVESFLVNVGLSLRMPDAAPKLRRRVHDWAAQRLRVYIGRLPSEARRWRAPMERQLGWVFACEMHVGSRTECKLRTQSM